MIDVLRDVVAGALMVTGALLALIAAIGMFRMPDVYARLHVATKPATLSLVATLAAAAIRAPSWGAAALLVLALVLQLWTVPAASHLLGRATRRSGVPPATPDALDESADD
ncbi:MAG: monovalent cation/H(+) antiporter subunit G [Actinomycetes bacterium]